MQSHPSWVCGLKHSCAKGSTIGGKSHPSWVCGLKLTEADTIESVDDVTPFVGVWIETSGRTWRLNGNTKSHPSWVCGLKQKKTDCKRHNLTSHPSWVCGLKQTWTKRQRKQLTSHPSWVCGLKPRAWKYLRPGQNVTPFVGVWIETIWLMIALMLITVTPFVGVWIETPIARKLMTQRLVTPFVGVWIETHFGKFYINSILGHTLRGCVDWNRGIITTITEQIKSHPSWVCGLKQYHE
mgnify:CR=1 FL=1